MTKMRLSPSALHPIPSDLRSKLAASKKARDAWEDITPLARNEWICWITSPKKKETRVHHITRAIEELASGKRRPCCWAGCSHR